MHEILNEFLWLYVEGESCRIQPEEREDMKRPSAREVRDRSRKEI